MSRNIRKSSLFRHGVPLMFVKDEAGVKVMQYTAHGKSQKRGHGGREAVFSPQGKKHSTLRVQWANQNSNVEQLVRIPIPRNKDHITSWIDIPLGSDELSSSTCDPKNLTAMCLQTRDSEILEELHSLESSHQRKPYSNHRK
jgi:hypothetical protein